MGKLLYAAILTAVVAVGLYILFQPKTPSVDVSITERAQATMTPSPTATPTLTVSAPSGTLDTSKIYTATLSTQKGDIVIALTADKTPKTVENFVNLAQAKFYDNTVFHRVISGFMIQGGDPKGDGTGGPGYRFEDEPFTGEYTRGTVAMANAGPDTNGSQFFIMHADTPLPKNYVIFGSVISGIETVDAIAESPVVRGLSGENSTPVTPVVITSVTITTK